MGDEESPRMLRLVYHVLNRCMILSSLLSMWSFVIRLAVVVSSILQWSLCLGLATF